MADEKKSHIQENLIAGILTLLPIAATWFVIDFLMGILIAMGAPTIRWLAETLEPRSGIATAILLSPLVQGIMAIVLVVAGILFLGAIARNVLGKRLIKFAESVLARIPLISSVYGAVRKLIDALSQQSEAGQQVVLIDFPSPEMKTIGIVTRTMTDIDTGEELAAVFVPTTPNPTNGYLEIVPMSRLTMTDWEMDDAMNFIISGGAVGPDSMNYSKAASPLPASPFAQSPDLSNPNPDDAR